MSKTGLQPATANPWVTAKTVATAVYWRPEQGTVKRIQWHDIVTLSSGMNLKMKISCMHCVINTGITSTI